MNFHTKTLLGLLILIAFSCAEKSDKHLVIDYPPYSQNGSVNVVVEIPAGTSEKWEVNKVSGKLEQDTLDGLPRVIDYLPYPANYGFIPQTILAKESGGDGDPLDIMVIGPMEERGTVVESKLIGVLLLTDNGEQDDKLIAISSKSKLYHLNNLDELNLEYPGILEIIELWFTNYKGHGKMVSEGFGSKEEAQEILAKAVEAFY